MVNPDPIDPLERQLWARFAGPPGVPGTPGACPSTMELAAYLDGRLADAARGEVEAHLVLCSDCREALHEVGAIGTDESLPFVAPALIESARALVAARPAVQRRGWAAAARWSFAAAASLAMALLAFQAGASFAGTARPAEDLAAREMSLGLLGPAEPWETGLDPLPLQEGLP